MSWRCFCILLPFLWPLILAAEERIFVCTGGKEGDAGIYACTFDEGKLTPPQQLLATGQKAEVVLGHDKTLLYAAIPPQEGKDSGELIGFKIQENGTLLESSRLSEGVGTYCKLALSNDGLGLVAASFGQGEVDSFHLNADGVVNRRVSRITFPRFARGKQEVARAHDVEFHQSGRLIFASDTANKRVYSLHFHPKTAELKLLGHVTSESFQGPRHLIQDEASRFLYVLNQGGSSVVVFRQANAGKLLEIQAISTLPSGQQDHKNSSAEILIHPSGRFLYASNRGHNSLTVFVRRSDGTLKKVQNISSGGEVPWSFVLADNGNYLICSNRKSHNLVVFAINQDTGELTATEAEISIPDPVKMAISS